MATASYLIPVGDLSLEKRIEHRIKMDLNLVEQALKVKVRDDERDLVIRDTLPNTDLGVAAPGGVALAAQEDWLMAAAAAVAAEGPLVWATLNNERCIGFFGLGIANAPNLISRVRFQLGNGAIRAVYQIEQLESRLEPAGYFSEGVFFTRNEQVRILLMSKIAFGVNTARIHMMARTVEPIGGVVAAPSV